MLLGFLVVDSESARQQACRLLSSGSLSPLSDAVLRCLAFYTYTGAITEQCKGALEGLLRGLQQPAPEP